MNARSCWTLGLLAVALVPEGRAADVPGSKDPPDVKYYTGSER